MRNGDIIKSFKREINLSTKVVRDKSKFNRKALKRATLREVRNVKQ